MTAREQVPDCRDCRHYIDTKGGGYNGECARTLARVPIYIRRDVLGSCGHEATHFERRKADHADQT